MNYYFDTSALVKHFHQEEGTDKITNLIRNKDHQIILLDIAPIELLSAVYRRYRNQEITNEELDTVLTGIKHELRRFKIEPLDNLIIEESMKLFNQFGKKYGLRTLDSLHIACFNLIETENLQIVSSDNIMCEIAAELGFVYFNPIMP